MWSESTWWDTRLAIYNLLGHDYIFVLDIDCQGMAISKLRVSVAEELSSSAEQLLRQKVVQSSISPGNLLGGDPKHMHSSQDAGEL